MKAAKIIFLTALGNIHIASAQNVGIGTNVPTARLHVADSNVLFSGLNQWQVPLTPGNPPLTGTGIRMMWYADKAAFRAGAVFGNEWDKDNIGPYSFATGLGSRASGEVAFAAGSGSIAAGDYAIAMGGSSTASGVGSVALGQSASAGSNYSTAIGFGANVIPFAVASTAIGYGTNVTGPYSTALGYEAEAFGLFSLSLGYRTSATNGAAAIGYENLATGFYSMAMGDSSYAGGISAFAIGHKTTANANYSFALGNNTKAKATNAFVAGAFNDTTATNRIFEIGNGTADNNRSNALTMLSNGNLGIGVLNPGVRLAVSGNASVSGGLTVGSFALPGYPYTLDVFGMGLFRGSNYLTIINSTGSEDTYIRGGKPGAKVFINELGGMGAIITASNVGIGNTNPIRPLSFPPVLGEKILLYPGATGEVGIGVYGNELRIHTDYAPARISFGYQDNAGNFTQTMWLNNSTSVLTVGGTSYPSDIRFKKQITPLSNALEKLMTLNGVEYYLRKDEFPQLNFSNQRQTGLLAQQVEKVMPSAVYDITEDGYKGVDYAKLVPLLIESVKEQNRRIDTLEKKLSQTKQ